MAGIDPRYYYLTMALLGLCTVVGLVIAFRFQREVNHDLAPTSEKDVLGPLERAYHSGLMDEAELRKIRESIERQKAGELGPASRRSVIHETDPIPGETRPRPLSETQADDD